MAEGQGFEPWIGLTLCRFSRPVHSTTLPPLRTKRMIRDYHAFVKPQL
jgi:hypothetical protein